MAFDQLSASDARLHWGITKLDILQKLWQQRGITGKGIRVGVLDSGNIPTHPDLNLTPNVVNDFSAGAMRNAADAHHGAWCSGLIAASGAQVLGVAPEAQLAYGKVKVSSISMAQGVEWLTALTPAVHIISISLELFKANAKPESFEKLSAAILAAIKKGKIVVAAVGNEATRATEIVERFPAAFAGVIAVGAVKQDFSIHEESGMNKSLDLLAPGQNLLTTPLDTGVKTDFGRTSAAAAFAAGAIALVLQALKKNKKKMSPEELEALLKETALFPFPNALKCQSSLFGCGIINPVAAVEKIEASAVITSERSGRRISTPNR